MVAANPLDGYLIALEDIVSQGYYYNQGPTRCTGVDHYVDCSGMVTLALNMAGIFEPCNNSFGFAVMCNQAVRPPWMNAAYGPGVGTQLTVAQAMMIPGAWGFHGAPGSNGQSPDYLGDGHIKTSLGQGRSIEAMSQALGINYSTFDAPSGFINFCALPPMLLEWFAPPPPKVPPMMDEQVRAYLRDPGQPGKHPGGWWIGYDNGLVDYFADGGAGPFHGGMCSPDDVKNFAAHGEHLAELRLRTRKDGSPGFQIVAQSGNVYVPENDV